MNYNPKILFINLNALSFKYFKSMVRFACNNKGIEINSTIGTFIPIISLFSIITTGFTKEFGTKKIKS